MRDPQKLSSTTKGKIDMVFPPSSKLDSPPSNGTVHTSLRCLLPPPPPKNNSSMHLPSSKSVPPPLPPPPPKFTSAVPVSGANDKDHIPSKSSPLDVPVVSDTLVKLMEYGDDDDDIEENESELLKNNPNRIAATKPFWAV